MWPFTKQQRTYTFHTVLRATKNCEVIPFAVQIKAYDMRSAMLQAAEIGQRLGLMLTLDH
jgi:hypothetical protein